jgi:hypothetical protein
MCYPSIHSYKKDLKNELEVFFVYIIMLTLEDIVEMDNKKNEHLPWNKLNKSLKLKRIMDFANLMKERDQLDEEKTNQLKQMLRDKLERKCLQRTKDVIYNKEEERIESIPALVCIQQKYTLRTDAISPLNSLAPKNKTVKKS